MIKIIFWENKMAALEHFFGALRDAGIHDGQQNDSKVCCKNLIRVNLH